MGKFSKGPDPLLQTHYEVLGLPQDCSFKEIREAFLSRSKQIHPDINKDAHCHQSFLRLNEAYHILIKPHKRQIYDASLLNPSYGNSSYGPWVDHQSPFGRAPEWRDETIWSQRDRSKDKFYQSKPYYGIKGVNRVSNTYIAAGCVMFMMLGAVFHYFVVKKTSSKALEELNAHNKASSDWYLETRRRAMASGSTLSVVNRLSKEWEIHNDDKGKK